MKKSLLVGLLVFLSFTSLSASSIQEEAYNEWIQNKTENNQQIGIGFNENGLGIVYGVNTDFSFYGTNKSNLYSFIELSNDRIEMLFGYDLLQQYGFKNFQLIPEIGLSVDTSSAKIGSLSSLKLRYNITNDIGIGTGVKYFFNKPITNSGDNTDTKFYYFTYLSYQF